MKMRCIGMAAALMCSVAAQAQSGAQLKAGLNLANVSVTDNGRVNKASQLTSFQVGIVTDMPLAGDFITLQPGVLFTGKGSKTEAGAESSTFYSKATTNPYYIEVPVNLLFKAPLGGSSKLFVGAGPYAAVGVGGKTKIDNKTGPVWSNREEKIEFSNDDPTTLEYEEGAGFGIMRRFDYGLNGTAGIEGKSVVLGVNYGYGLAKLQSGSNSNTDNNNKHRVFSFTIGFKL